jgi:hypothetical protein
VAEIGIHLDDGHRARLVEHAPEAVAVRDPQPLLAGAVEDLDPWVGGRQLVGQLAGPVRGAVVDDEQVGLREGLENGARDGGQVLPLVVGWQNDPDAAPGGEADRRGRLRSGGGQRPTPR